MTKLESGDELSLTLEAKRFDKIAGGEMPIKDLDILRFRARSARPSGMANIRALNRSREGGGGRHHDPWGAFGEVPREACPLFAFLSSPPWARLPVTRCHRRDNKSRIPPLK